MHDKTDFGTHGKRKRTHCERTGKTPSNQREALRTQDRTHERKHTAKVKENKKEDWAIVREKERETRRELVVKSGEFVREKRKGTQDECKRKAKVRE